MIGHIRLLNRSARSVVEQTGHKSVDYQGSRGWLGRYTLKSLPAPCLFGNVLNATSKRVCETEALTNVAGPC